MCPIEDSLSKNPFFEPPSPDWQRFCRATSSLGRNQSAHSGTPPPIPQRQKAVKGRRSGMPQLQPSARHRICLFRSRGWQTGKQITVPFHPGNLTETVPLSLATNRQCFPYPVFQGLLKKTLPAKALYPTQAERQTKKDSSRHSSGRTAGGHRGKSNTRFRKPCNYKHRRYRPCPCSDHTR